MSEPIPESIPTSSDKISHRAAKKLRPTNPALSTQAAQISSLMSNPEIPLNLPPPSTATTAKQYQPPEIVPNVQGSSAGAGSGEFHVYKASRRREYERLRGMEEEARKEKEDEEWARRVEEKKRRDETERERNRAKRARKKGKQGKEGEKGKGRGKVESEGDRSGQEPMDGIERGGNTEKMMKKKNNYNNGGAVRLGTSPGRADSGKDADDVGDALHKNGVQQLRTNEPHNKEGEDGEETGVIIHDDD